MTKCNITWQITITFIWLISKTCWNYVMYGGACWFDLVRRHRGRMRFNLMWRSQMYLATRAIDNRAMVNGSWIIFSIMLGRIVDRMVNGAWIIFSIMFGEIVVGMVNDVWVIFSRAWITSDTRRDCCIRIQYGSVIMWTFMLTLNVLPSNATIRDWEEGGLVIYRVKLIRTSSSGGCFRSHCWRSWFSCDYGQLSLSCDPFHSFGCR